MDCLKVGDIVARKSYGFDILFRVEDIKCCGDEKIVVLKGICYRIEADAPESDLLVQPEESVIEHTVKANMHSVEKSEVVPCTSKKRIVRNVPKRIARKFCRSKKV